MSNQLINFFKNAYEKNRLTHLYLLSGNKGKNKLELAYEVANIILTPYDHRENLKELISNNNHSQIYYVAPIGDVIKKEQIINLQNEFTKTSLLNAPRIYIIEDVDLISSSAANSLLKFMEEPESNLVYGFLITSNLSNVLKTIISRSQVVRVVEKEDIPVFNLVNNDEISNYHKINISYLTNDVNQYLEYSNDANIIAIIEFIKDLFNNWNNKEYALTIELSKSLEYILYEKSYYAMFLELLLVNFNDLLKYSLKEQIEFEELITSYKNIIIKNDRKSILSIINLIQEEINKQKYYINISLSIELLLINLEKSR